MIRMPFGKHKGSPLNEVPRSYLEWCYLEACEDRPGLKKAIAKELERRDAEGESCRRSGTPPRQQQQPPDALRATIKTWYRELVMRYHPDRTLDNGAAMKAVNDAYERLTELLGLPR